MTDNIIEISIKDFFDQVNKYKLYLVTFFIISLILPLIVNAFEKKTYHGDLSIENIGIKEFAKYEGLAEISFRLDQRTYGFNFKNKITANYILNLLKEELSKKSEINKSINDKINLDDKVLEEFSSESILRTLETFEVDHTYVIDKETGLYTGSKLDLNLVSEDKKLISELFMIILEHANSRVRIFLDELIQLKLEINELYIEGELNVIENKMKNINNAISKELDIKKNYLIDQAEIARSLGIEEPYLQSLNIDINTGTDDNYFLRGYKAIEKEIELLTDQSSYGIVSLENKINLAKLNELKVVFVENNDKKLLNFFRSNSPISNPSTFKAGEVSIDNVIIIEQQFSLINKYIISILIWFALSIIYVAITLSLRVVDR